VTIVRNENPGSIQDLSAIRSVNEAAFESSVEADLIDKLRSNGDVLISLVAESDNKFVGHILFSRMWIETPSGLVPAVALAPMAVLPEYQRRGIGGLLIRQGLDSLRAQGEKIVIVVGHATYYPQFGFSSDRTRGLESPFPAEAFMAMELASGALDGVRGRVVYPAAFEIA
jgi:putative acetyltransferase